VILHANLTLKDFHSAVLDIPSHGSSVLHSHVRELIIHGKTDIGYSAVEQLVTFCPDLRKLVLSPINPTIQNNAIEIAFDIQVYIYFYA
jgi:hypothetical protein